ncbi:lipopolysaccharide kinase [Gemmatirosa kalamazoonensis]|uniref:Lipopolysaccharide kinase n=1 Tax=Gemmatirosa kalamazoonensis TaxID=861299 RepID=W0RKW2_9BACT|nr:lipopolysaccharide kinase InaA family protein [Gemmatirosa kalamazoonensis]AHG91406.1 lipopolysaccharide kinase [Gemmatirosa kalamazoonensis]
MPAGYTGLSAGGVHVICLAECAGAIREALGDGTLHEWAASHPERRELRGRGSAYAATLPDGETQVVVRHSRHGGLLAPLTGDRFLAPTRAPRELATSIALRDAGVRTPQMVAYAIYPAGPLLRRADVATRLVPDARDLGDAIGAVPDDAWIDATAALLRALAAAGARHPDLNLKNVLLAADGAWVLDVDVVALGTPPEAAARANWARLERSLLKWRRERGLAIADAALAELARRVA